MDLLSLSLCLQYILSQSNDNVLIYVTAGYIELYLGHVCIYFIFISFIMCIEEESGSL